jgi:hypothetical protein
MIQLALWRTHVKKGRVLGLLLAVLVVGPVHATTISVQPPTLDVILGQIFSLDIDITNVTDLYAFQFDLGFTPGVLSAVAITEGGFLPSRGTTAFVPGTIDNFGGSITFTGDSLIGMIPGVNGSGVLATVDFLAVGAGISPITISNELLLDSTFDTIEDIAAGGTVTVQTVEPGTFGLLFGAIAVVMLYAFRRRPLC